MGQERIWDRTILFDLIWKVRSLMPCRPSLAHSQSWTQSESSDWDNIFPNGCPLDRIAVQSDSTADGNSEVPSALVKPFFLCLLLCLPFRAPAPRCPFAVAGEGGHLIPCVWAWKDPCSRWSRGAVVRSAERLTWEKASLSPAEVDHLS